MSTPASGESPHDSPEVQRYRPRACQSCARSKMRCVWPSEPGATPCQRCAKIRAPCTLPEVNPRRRRGPSTRVGQLEEKIDGIMSLLNASQQIQQNSQSPVPESNKNGIESLLNPLVETTRPELPEPEHPYQRVVRRQEEAQARSLAQEMPASHIGRTPTIDSIEIIPGFWMTVSEADRAMNMYRSVYIHYFPFVPIPALMTAFDMHTRSPFLFRAIVTVTAPQNAETQKDVKRWFREYIAQHVVVEQERRLDLLQGLLVFLAWGEHHFYMESQATSFLHLAMSLVIDLELNRPVNPLGRVPYSLIHEATRVFKIGRPGENHSLDDVRAMLGCFYMYSVPATLFRRMENKHFTAYMSECCDRLERAQEYESDKFLVALVRMQRLVIRIFDIFPNPEMEVVAPRSLNNPLQMSITVIRKELDALVESQPPEVECNALLWMIYHGVLTRLYEPVIYMRSSLSSNDTDASRRTESLWACLQSAKDFFAAYTTIPSDSLGSLPYVCTSHLSFAVVTTSRILFLEDPDWDVNLARKHLDFAAVCQQLADRFDEADRMAQQLGRRRKFIDPTKPVLAMYRDKIRWIRQWYLTRLAGMSGVGGRGGSEALVGEAAAASRIPASIPGTSKRAGDGGGGGAMDVDQQTQAQAPQTMLLPSPGDLDEAFWQALLDFDGRSAWAGWAE